MKMKKLIIEDEQEGLISFLGQRITLFCASYFYTGELVGVNDTCVKLKDASIVYETGELTSGPWKDAQKLPHDWYVSISMIESFGLLK